MTDKEFLKDRDEALLSMDKDKIIKYLKKYGENTDFSENERLFWTTIHTARVNLFSLPAEEREKSRIWLIENKHRKVMEREE